MGAWRAGTGGVCVKQSMMEDFYTLLPSTFLSQFKKGALLVTDSISTLFCDCNHQEAVGFKVCSTNDPSIDREVTRSKVLRRYTLRRWLGSDYVGRGSRPLSCL